MKAIVLQLIALIYQSIFSDAPDLKKGAVSVLDISISKLTFGVNIFLSTNLPVVAQAIFLFVILRNALKITGMLY